MIDQALEHWNKKLAAAAANHRAAATDPKVLGPAKFQGPSQSGYAPGPTTDNTTRATVQGLFAGLDQNDASANEAQAWVESVFANPEILPADKPPLAAKVGVPLEDIHKRRWAETEQALTALYAQAEKDAFPPPARNTATLDAKSDLRLAIESVPAGEVHVEAQRLLESALDRGDTLTVSLLCGDFGRALLRSRGASS